LFIRKGYRNTTLSDIIKQAGGSRETIYDLFDGKLGMFQVIISDWGDESADFVLKSISQATPPREFLVELGMRLLEIWLSPQGKEIHRTILSEGISSPEILEAWYQGGGKKVVSALAQYIESQVKMETIEVSDPMIFARQFQFLLYGEIASPVMAGDDQPIDAKASVTRTVELMLRSASPDI